MKNDRTWIRGIIGTVLAIVGTGYAFYLRVSGLISTEAAFLGFTSLFLFVAIVVYVLPQLQELNLRDMKVQLREMEKTEERIFAEVRTVQELTLKLADLALLDALNIGRVAERLEGGRIGKAIRQWRERRIDRILDLIEATPEQSAHLRRYVPAFQTIEDAYNRFPDDLEERKRIVGPQVEKLIAELSSDIE